MREPALPEQPKRGKANEGDTGGFGRIVTEGYIDSRWHCRWCGEPLMQDGSAVICAGVCDRPGHVIEA